MAPTTWIIDQYILDRAIYHSFPRLDSALREAGHNVVVCKYSALDCDFLDGIAIPDPSCVIAYGSVIFVKNVKSHFLQKAAPIAYDRYEALSYSGYAAHYAKFMLNSDFNILPFAELKRRILGGSISKAFIRPDSPKKYFSGLTITSDNAHHEFSSLDQIERIDPELLCVYAPPKPIHEEFRFVISDHRVLTGSMYLRDGRPLVAIDIDPMAQDLASVIATQAWQPDSVYTCDICTSDYDGEKRAYLLELNSFSSSGLYLCDTRLIAEEVSACAEREFQSTFRVLG